MTANPFLFNEEPYNSPSSTVSNPFLMEEDVDINTSNGYNDNPFLSQTASTISTNPFSFDPMELEPPEVEVAQIQHNSSNTHIDLFGDISNEESTAPCVEPLVTTELYREDMGESSVSPQKPVDLNLKYTHQTANGPPRPPPPRPPPSKETQDLLMSVMGAMDATSSTLLDKIPPTRTPSPISMRDLHSPSPTPETNCADLVDISEKPLEPLEKEIFTVTQNCDINQNPAITEETVIKAPNSKPPRPIPPVRPPKPPPPQKYCDATKTEPKNDILIENTTTQSTVIEKNDNDDIDLFGVEQPQKCMVTNADILNLYNTPKQKHKTDLLSDPVEEDFMMPPENNIAKISTEGIQSKNGLNNVISPTNLNTEVIRDNFLSPEHLQDEFQMDLSDSQSKESVSSVTFNPFSATEDFSNQAESPNISTIEHKPMDIFENTGDFADNTVEIVNDISTTDVFGIIAQEPVVEESPLVSTNTTTEQTAIQEKQFALPTTNTQQSPLKGNAFTSLDTTTSQQNTTEDPFGSTNISIQQKTTITDPFASSNTNTQLVGDDFDDFAKKFDSVKTDENKDLSQGCSVWGNDLVTTVADTQGFGQDEGFDAFLALQEPPCVPQSTPNRISKSASQESDEDKDFSVFIRPKTNEDIETGGLFPAIAPPPSTVSTAFIDTSPRFNPFDNQNETTAAITPTDLPFEGELKRSDSQESPPTPLYDEDVSQPLEPFPRTTWCADGWEMQLRQPNKKKITGQRFWKKIFVKIVYQMDCVLLQLFNQKDDKDPFQELPLQPCYSVSDIGAQQYDQFGKIFTIKLQYIFYKERPGVRPGQVKKAERITNKLSQFAAYAMQGDYQGVKEFGSDLKKLGLPVEHAPQISQLMKLGSLNYEDLKQFSFCIEEALFKLTAHRDRALHYKMEEVQITAVDELYVEQDHEGHVEKQIARVRLLFLGFLTGMPDIELGINDMRRQGKEVVGRHDIIPVVTEEWIRLEDVEFHSCIQQEDYNNTQIIKFKPPDACYIELMRFRVRPPKNRELPLQLKAQICVTGHKVELRADVLVPGFASRKLGQIPCEDVMIRFPIPECWIYLFRVEKHFRYGSVKSAHRRTGKIKGIERILGTMETLQENLIEVTSGQAKYEHQHRAIVWRCPRLPKEGQGAYTTHNMVCRIALTSYDQMPEKLAEYCYVEFTMPATQVSHTTCRSVSLQNSDSDEPPEKYVRYLARHEYRVGIEHTEGESPNPYAAATTYATSKPNPPPAVVDVPAKIPEDSSSDSD